MDEKWINEFSEKEKDFQIFYKDNINYIRVYVLYVNKEKCLDKVKEKNMYLETKNKISKTELKNTINSYRKSEKVPYKLISILKHNIDIEPDDVSRSLKDDFIYNYTDSLSTIDNIDFNKSITMFEDLNSIFLIFYETDKESLKNTTKRVKFKHKQTHKKERSNLIIHK